MINKFVHFRTQSSYSMLESSIKIDKLVELAKNHQMNAVCLSDRGNLFASLEFSLSATKSKIQPIHGSIFNILFQKDTPSNIEKHNLKESNFSEILIIAKDKEGYKNLLKLISLTFTQNDRNVCNHITFDDLQKYNAGLIILSAYTDGIIGKSLLDNNFDDAKYYAKKIQAAFGDRFYFEIMRHNLKKEREIESSYLKIACNLGIPLLATNRVLFSDITMHDAHDVLLCIASGVVREVQDRKRVSNQCYFKSSEEMISLFKDLPEAIKNTVYLSERCSAISESSPPALPKFTDTELSEEELIHKQANKGLESKLEQKFIKENSSKEDQNALRKIYFDRLSYELDIICKMDFAGYFLIVSDFIKWSKKNNIAVGPGRGSGAGSIIAWTLEITDLDPIEFGLLFERFLNPERISMPDFDIDFCQERRQEVISYVRTKYGDDRVGQIITFGTLQAKAAIKDVSRVLGLRYLVADYITELVPFNAVHPVTLKQALSDVPELKKAASGKGLYNIEDDPKLIQQVLSTALSLEGLHRHSSTHAAGIVIANQAMYEIIPVYKDINSDMLISQYSMKYCELAGLVKFDFLGLQTLTVISKTINLLSKVGTEININNIDFKDKKTFDMLSKGLSTGVFQFESVGMKNSLRNLRPDNIDDIIALGALYRPGPMDNIPTYIACKHNKQEVDYLHPLLEPILKSTYGVIIYQEQVMEIARVLSGYSLATADLLRRAMGKKVKAEMDAQEEMFVNGAVKNKVSVDKAKFIFETVAKFAGYGFNKSHASAYGVISYQTAFLKANFPAEFLVASLNLDIDNSDKVNVFLQEAKNFDIEIIVPDINKSQGWFSICSKDGKKSIIFALGAIKNVTTNLGNAVLAECRKNGEFKSIIDFVQRIDPKLLNKRSLENIIKSGCFDKLHSNRNMLVANIPKIITYCSSYHKEQKSMQFSMISVSSNSSDILTPAKTLSSTEIAYNEFDVLGLFLNNHPLSELSESLEKCNVKKYDYVKNGLISGSHSVKLSGIIIKKDLRMSKRGRFLTLLISDPETTFEVTVYNEDTFKNYAHLLNIKDAVIIFCEIYKDQGSIRITANRFVSIEDELQSIQHNLKLYPKNSLELNNIINILQETKNTEKNNSVISIFLPVNTNFVAKITMPKYFYLKENDINKLSNLAIRTISIKN